MRLEMEVSQEVYDALQAGGPVRVVDRVEQVTVRVRDSLLVDEVACSHVEFCAAGLVGKDAEGVHVRVWLRPEERKVIHVSDRNG